MRPLLLHNTLGGAVEEFQPLESSRVTMYVCGPTVYGPAHVGNARPAVVFDVLYRLLKNRYGKVLYARNITDIDDKIISAAQANDEKTDSLAARWEAAYLRQMEQLGVLPPDYQPRATMHIGDIIAMIKKLLDKKYAYLSAAHVLFHVPSFADYGALSNRDRAQMMDGARVEVAAYKKDAADFILWKPSDESQPGWESPWGRGRPGWHIECSAMAAKCFGEQIDLHGGGQDLIFPHHENEIAQSRCAHDAKFFARYWLHNGHVDSGGEKMSKSSGNVCSLEESLSRFHAETVRYALLSTHYRRPLNWNAQLLNDAKSALDSLYRALSADAEINGDDNGDGFIDGQNNDSEILPQVESALASDINTPGAFAKMHRAAGDIHRATDAKQATILRRQLRASGRAMGVLNLSADEWFHQRANRLSATAIENKIQRRKTARESRDFQTADDIRRELEAGGVLLEDSTAGTKWRVK